MLYKTLTKKEEGIYLLTSITCSGCATDLTIEIPSSSVFQMNQGALIQNILPEQEPSVRERFVSGICGKCWDSMFGGNDE